MRQKTPHIVLSFASTTEAMAVDALAHDVRASGVSFPGRMIPLPPAIDAGCGLAWSAPLDEKEELLETMARNSLAYESINIVDLY